MDVPDRATDPALRAALAEQQRLGVLGTSVDDAILHSERYLPWLDAGCRVVDLGSGAGVPGLVIAVRRPDVRVVLLDARARRTDQLRRLVGRLGLGDRVTVVTGRADVIARMADHHEAADAVVARSFGGPTEVCRAAIGLLKVGGRLVVSEPPDRGMGADRWTTALRASTLRRTSPPGSSLFVAERFT